MCLDTGDVQFICLERRDDADYTEPDSPDTADTPLATPHSRRSSGSSSSSSNATSASRTLARKRVIHAHSDILIRRSEYFATMLRSSFAETSAAPGERRTYTIVVEEADFVTVYWLLKWVYANWLLFKAHDNPKAAIEGVGAGWSARWLESSRRQDEWAWTAFDARSHMAALGEDFADGVSIASVETAMKQGKGNAAPASAPPMRGSSSTGSSAGKAAPASSTAPRPPPSPIRRSTGGASSSSAVGSSTTLSVPGDSASTTSPTRSRKDDLSVHLPPALSPPSFSRQRARPPPSAHAHPLSPIHTQATQRQPDPHAHPCAAPPPASALSMYQVAHRYGMPGLAALALEHMLSTITPPGSFALLLASATWDELHRLVEVCPSFR